jgi:hypothetical protein
MIESERERARGFEEGLALIDEGAYWDAHEALEVAWLSLPGGAERDATQALIQFAAAAYKIEQAREGRETASMQRGMQKLIASARSLLDADTSDVSWNVDALRSAIDDLDGVRRGWEQHHDESLASQRAAATAAELVAALTRREESTDS